MKSIFQHIALRLAVFCAALLAVSAMNGCSTLKEDNSDCPQGLYLRFHYTYHMGDDGCRLRQQVDKLDLFIYKADDGSLYQHKTLPIGALDSDNGVQLMLPAGDYHMIAWGNYDEQAHLIGVHDTYSQMQLRLKAQSGNFSFTGSLFHGDIDVTTLKNKRVSGDVYMTKDTNAVHIVIADTEDEVIDASQFTITMTGTNGIYNYDNALAAEALDLPLNYIPTYQYDADQMWAQADFYVYRLFSDESDGVCLKIAANSHPDTPLHNLCLSREILRCIPEINTDEDLDREDDYTLVYKVRNDGGAWTLVSISINGWEIISQNSGI